VTSALILLLCLSVALHESGTRNALLGPWLNNTEVYLTPYISTQNHTTEGEVVVAIIVWYLDFQLPMQSVPITTNVVSSNLDQGEVYNIMWSSLSVTCDRSVVFSGSTGFLYHLNWPPRYYWNVVESGVKHHRINKQTLLLQDK